jgi:hypothetical protein
MGWFPTKGEAQAWKRKFQKYRREVRVAVKDVNADEMPEHVEKIWIGK